MTGSDPGSALPQWGRLLVERETFLRAAQNSASGFLSLGNMKGVPGHIVSHLIEFICPTVSENGERTTHSTTKLMLCVEGVSKTRSTGTKKANGNTSQTSRLLLCRICRKMCVHGVPTVIFLYKFAPQ